MVSAPGSACHSDGTTAMALLHLSTPPISRIVPDGVVDAFGWCDSDVLERLRRPPAGSVAALDTTTPLTAQNPARMVFVMREECTFLPREMAALHLPGMGFEDEWALAPYAIDDAT